MIELNDDKTLFSFDRDLEPVLTVKSGETVRIRTKDCFSNQLTGPQDTMDDLDWDAINPATGPVFVEGAKAGGALKVRIENIEFDERTCSATGQDEGVCGNRFTEWATHYCKIQGNTLAWDERLNIPLRPMIGVIGVAPEGEPVNCGTPGSHAAMGDGEVSVSGAEVAGYATVTLTALPELKLVNPLIENDTHFGIIVSAESLDAAAELAVQQMVDLLASRTSESEADLVMLLSLVADVQVCQMVDPQKTVRFMVPKYVLDAIGFAL